MAEQVEAKQRMRVSMESLRKDISEPVRIEHSAVICRHLFDLCERMAGERSGLTVMSFMPFRGEVDVYPLTKRLWENGYSVAMPKVDPSSRNLGVCLVRSLADLEPGAWGIMEPRADIEPVQNISILDLVVMPGLAFDHGGGRLGYGGGYYDRFFRRFAHKGLTLPTRVGVCFGLQLVEKVPMDTHDYPVDYVATEQGVMQLHRVQ